MLTLWIIDDNIALLTSLKLALYGELNVRTFSDPRACLLALKSKSKETPDAILTDFEMPGMNGLEFLQAVLKEKPRIKVYLFSSNLTNELVREADRAGARGWMGKPLELKDLKAMIEKGN